MRQYLSVNYFLAVGGTTLLALGVLGLITWSGGILKENSVFYLDDGENVAHIVLGAVALLLVGTMRSQTQLLKWVVVLVGLVALFFGIYGFSVAGKDIPNTFGLANLENPLDNLLHLVVGAWALLAAFWGRSAPAAM